MIVTINDICYKEQSKHQQAFCLASIKKTCENTEFSWFDRFHQNLGKSLYDTMIHSDDWWYQYGIYWIQSDLAEAVL